MATQWKHGAGSIGPKGTQANRHVWQAFDGALAVSFPALFILVRSKQSQQANILQLLLS
jgi:hypothetical protein